MSAVSHSQCSQVRVGTRRVCRITQPVQSGQSWDTSCLPYHTASAVRSELGHVVSAVSHSQCSQVRVGTRRVCRITQPVQSGQSWDTSCLPYHTASAVRSELGHVVSAVSHSQCSQVRVGTRRVCRITQPVQSGQSWDTSCLPYHTASAVRSELGHVVSAVSHSQCSQVRVGTRRVCRITQPVQSGQSWDTSCLPYHTASAVRSELGHVMSAVSHSQCSQVRVGTRAVSHSQCSQVRVGTRHVCRITQPVVPVAGVWMGQLTVRSGRGWDTSRMDSTTVPCCCGHHQ